MCVQQFMNFCHIKEIIMWQKFIFLATVNPPKIIKKIEDVSNNVTSFVWQLVLWIIAGLIKYHPHFFCEFFILLLCSMQCVAVLSISYMNVWDGILHGMFKFLEIAWNWYYFLSWQYRYSYFEIRSSNTFNLASSKILVIVGLSFVHFLQKGT